jgi:spermidine/putrescine transport system ATP-binding protein
LGPSGCGKTTTLRVLGGFEDPSSGRVLLAGKEVTGLPPYKRDVNTVFQTYALFPHLNVFDNVAFGLRRKDVAKSEVNQRVNDMLELVDLAGYDKRKPRQLSGGQQQRVALARALVNKPQVLLLDEPLGALDLKLRKQMQLELKRIQTEVAISFVYVTHDQEEAMTMSDRVAVMRHGRILQLGSPEDIYERPATEFVASFLGASNLLDAEVADSTGELAAVHVENAGIVALPSASLNGSGTKIKVGVRPEKIRLEPSTAEVPAGYNELPGTIRLSTFVGVNYHFEVDGPSARSITVYEQNVGGRKQLKPGDAVHILWRPEDTFVVAPDEAIGPTRQERLEE